MKTVKIKNNSLRPQTLPPLKDRTKDSKRKPIQGFVLIPGKVTEVPAEYIAAAFGQIKDPFLFRDRFYHAGVVSLFEQGALALIGRDLPPVNRGGDAEVQEIGEETGSGDDDQSDDSDGDEGGEGSEEPTDLTGFTVKVAVGFIEEETEIESLNHWSEMDTRDGVKKAVAARIKALTEG